MSKKSIQQIMRALHRDIGYFLIGLTVIYALSGIVLVYRGTDFLKNEHTTKKQLTPNLSEAELGKQLRMRHFEIVKTKNDVIYFNNGSYNKSSGIATITEKRLPAFLDKLNDLHKRSSRNLSHIFSTIYGVLLLFLAISSFWMFNPNTKKFRRGLILASVGIIFSVLLLYL